MVGRLLLLGAGLWAGWKYLFKSSYQSPFPGKALKITSAPQRTRQKPTDPSVTRPHKGVDIGVPSDTPLYAVSGGTVTAVVSRQKSPEAGTYIEVDHGDGIFARYLHLNSSLVAKGDQITTGQKIGTTGSAGTGPHLHLELRSGSPSGLTLDPIAMIEGDWQWKSEVTRQKYEEEKPFYGSW